MMTQPAFDVSSLDGPVKPGHDDLRFGRKLAHESK